MVKSLESQMRRGADVKATADFATAAEALGAFSAMRGLVQHLEGKIAAQCDAVKLPQGVTKTAQHAIALLGELRINEDTVDLLMCATCPPLDPSHARHFCLPFVFRSLFPRSRRFRQHVGFDTVQLQNRATAHTVRLLPP